MFPRTNHISNEVRLLLRSAHGELVIAGVIRYLIKVGKIPETEVRVALQQSVGATLADEIYFAWDRRFEEGERAGELRGELKGVRKGKVEFLKRQLSHKFGPLPPEVLERLEGANDELLEKMLDRVLTAASLDAVF